MRVESAGTFMLAERNNKRKTDINGKYVNKNARTSIVGSENENGLPYIINYIINRNNFHDSSSISR